MNDRQLIDDTHQELNPLNPHGANYASGPVILKTTEYQEVEQDPEQSDSDMMEVITDHLNDGWELVEYRWAEGIKTWVFRK